MRKLGRTLVILIGLITTLAFSQVTTPGVSPNQYRIRAQDAIRIQVYGEMQINSLQQVYPDGRISAPFAGLIDAAGKTTAEIEAELVVLYKEKLKLKDPRVAVTIEVYRPLKANVTGAVLQGGSYETFKPGDNLLTLLSRGGGTIPDRADLRRATLTRGMSREVIPINLFDLLINGDTSQNYEIEDGDSLYVPFRKFESVSIQGAITAPGAYQYKEGMSLFDLVSQARGPIPIRSKMSEIIIMRPKTGVKNQFNFYKVNYVRLIKNQDQTQNPELLPGDSIYVSETKTPDLNQIGSIFNAVFLANRLLTDGIFGFGLFGN